MKITTESRRGISLSFYGFSMLFIFTLPNLTSAQVVPVNGATPAQVSVAINQGPGDQYDPHVSGNWVVYTSELSVRYHNLATDVDAEIPIFGGLSRDLLPDLSGSKIVFTRIISGTKTAVMVFDAATPAVSPVELDQAPATNRLGTAIGGNTVAYIDFGLEASGELVIHDLTTSTSVRITNDTNPDQTPAVSPDGNVVTWEHCDPSLSNCDIWQAVKNGAVWNVSTTSSSADQEGNPDTNGTVVVYDSFRNGDSDIFWRPVGGGSEVQLQLPGFELNSSIAGNFISFESHATTFGSRADLFVYDIANNRLYKLTDTPLVTEQLNDITLLTNNNLRGVWTSDEDGSGSRNIRGSTFAPPTFACQGGSSILGSSLPVSLEATITQGGSPNFADTYLTPYVAAQAGTITTWKAEFSGGNLINGGVGVPSGIQLKVFRHTSADSLQVVAAGAIHDPRSTLQTRFGGSYPFFSEIASVIEFTDTGLNVLPGDVIGLTIQADPAVGGYFYPLVSPGGTRVALSDVPLGGAIDLNDAYTGTLGWTPAVQINVNSCLSFNFLGFFQPVDNMPVLNVVTAGQAIPVKFSLSGNQGLNIFAAGYPASSSVACDASDPGDLIEETVTAGGSSLSYTATSDQYSYIWKTDMAWKGTCRILDVRLKDGTDHLAKFRFR